MAKPINKVIKILISSDILLITGFGFIAPIFAIFIAQRITLGDMTEAVKIAGFSMAIYWGVKSILQIPIGKYLDKNHGEKDDLYFVMIGNSLAALAAFGYIFSSSAWHLYLLQGVYSLGMAMNIPSWTAIFTRHIDKEQVAFEWATRSTFIGIGAGAAGALGGIIASSFGFNVLFVGVGVFALFSAILPIFIIKIIAPKDKISPRAPEVKGLQEPHLPKG